MDKYLITDTGNGCTVDTLRGVYTDPLAPNEALMQYLPKGDPQLWRVKNSILKTSEFLVTDTGNSCEVSSLVKPHKDALLPNQLLIAPVDVPAVSPDYWSIDGGAIVYDETTSVKDLEIKNIKDQRDLDMSQVTVNHNSHDWSFGPVDMSRFESKISRQRDFIWKADDGSHITLTPTVAENIAKKADDLLTQIFFDAEVAIAGL